MRTDSAAAGEDRSFVAALARGLAVMRAFGPERPRMTLADAARATGLTRASARRALLTLVALGYAESDGKTFALTPQVLALGYSYLSAVPLPRIAQPFLERVSERLNESCSLSILDGDEIVYLARAATRRIMSVGLAVGSRLPAFYTAMGRILLAGLPAEAFEALLAAHRPVSHTARTRTGPAALGEAIAEARRNGFALVDQELEIGLRSIAVPVIGPGGRIAAAINVSAEASRVPPDRLTGPFLAELRAAAAGISVAIGG